MFTSDHVRAVSVAAALSAHGWRARAIAGSLQQAERNEVMRAFLAGETRVLVSTDLTARGVDVAGVSLVVNLEPSSSPETHMHRVGRSGRFGTQGLALTLVVTKADRELVARFERASPGLRVPQWTE